MQGVAAGLVWTAGLAAIADVYPVDQLGFRLGLAETAGGAMGLLGPIIGGVLIVWVGLDETFALAAILPALALIPVFLIPETRGGPGVRQPLLPALQSLRRGAQGARRVLGARPGVAAVLALVEPLLPLDLADRLDLSSLGIGLVFGAGLLSYFALVPVGGWWSDKRGRRAPLIVGGVLMAVGLPFCAFGPAISVAIAFAVVGAGMAAMGAPTGPLMVEAVNEAGMAGPVRAQLGDAHRGVRRRVRGGPAARRGGERRAAVPRHHDHRGVRDRGGGGVGRAHPPEGTAVGGGFGRRAKGVSARPLLPSLPRSCVRG